ncbi:MAG TPA: hypothetical protein VJN95_14385 [Gemmatimonadales bacterium]|nr:hypothetical protein [Gemmatimonadales bacterium]
MNDPERPLTEDAARRLLARAVELDARLGSAVTLQELRTASTEAGISPAAFDAAVREAEVNEARPTLRSVGRAAVQNLLAFGAFWVVLEGILLPVIRLNLSSPVRTLGMLIALGAGILISNRLHAGLTRTLLIALGAGQAVLFIFDLAGIHSGGANVLTWAVTFTGFIAALATGYFGARRPRAGAFSELGPKLNASVATEGGPADDERRHLRFALPVGATSPGAS